MVVRAENYRPGLPGNGLIPQHLVLGTLACIAVGCSCPDPACPLRKRPQNDLAGSGNEVARRRREDEEFMQTTRPAWRMRGEKRLGQLRTVLEMIKFED